MRVVSLGVRAMNLSRYQASGIVNRPAQSNPLGGSQAWSSLDHNRFSKIETPPAVFFTTEVIVAGRSASKHNALSHRKAAFGGLFCCN